MSWIDTEEWLYADADDRIPMFIQLAAGCAGGVLTGVGIVWWFRARARRSIAILGLSAWIVAEAAHYAFFMLLSGADYWSSLQNGAERAYMVLQLVGLAKTLVLAALMLWLFMRTTRRGSSDTAHHA